MDDMSKYTRMKTFET
uniref:Uncharacterized protein n=1 Tax=Anguilla anguilla TaxID=7936 RepID=A0A0E9Q8C4_ANGAN